jgi:predicted nucleic acid-binding protein
MSPINRRDAIQPAFDTLLGGTDQVLPVDLDATNRAKDIVMGHPGILARDALPLAITEAHGIQKVASFDRGFDGFLGIVRLS